RLDQRFFPPKFNLAMLYSRQKKKDRTEQLYRDVLKEAAAMTDPQHLLKPVQIEAHCLLGILLNENPKRTDEAAKELLAAWELDPKNVEVAYALATFNLEHGHLDKAEEYAKKLVQLRPDDPRGAEVLKLIEQQKSAAP